MLVVLVLPISTSAGLFFWKDSSNTDFSATKNVQNMSLLASANSPFLKEENSLQIVDDIALDASSNSFGDADLIYKPKSDQISMYVVHKGDTLSEVAKMYDVSVNTIKWANNLNSNTLKEGQTLVILPISGVKYTVVKGDTLASIAKKYKGDADEIALYNDLDKTTSLVAGSTIIVPDGEVVNTPSNSNSGKITSSGKKEYVGYYLKPVTNGRRSQGLHGNNGIDFAAPIGTSILASASGQVIVSRMGGWNGGYGNYIVIKHNNGTQTLYAHVSQINVSVGQNVGQGDVIGAVGNTGKSTGAHLHFEIRGAKNPF